MSTRPQSQAAPPLEIGLLLLLGFLWGIPYALTKISLATIPPVTLVAARVLLAAAALWIVAILLGRNIPRRWDFVGSLFIQACVACVVPYTLITFGQKSVDSALAAILNSATPLFVCIISVVWTHYEPITARRLSGSVIGLGGVIVIAGASALLGFGRETIGQAAIIVATFSSAVSVIYGRRFADVAPEVVAAGMLTWASVVLIPLALVVEAPWHAAPSVPSLVALLINAVVATALGFALYFRLIRTIGSVGTASVGYLKPAVGVLIGCALMGESLTWILTLGLAAILIGVAIINGGLPVARLPWHAKDRAEHTHSSSLAVAGDGMPRS